MFDVVIIIATYSLYSEELAIRNSFLTSFRVTGFEAQIVVSISRFGV